MNTATAVSYAHTIARMVDCDPEYLLGLDARALDVLYFGILSDDASRHFRSMIDYLETPALEMYAIRAGLSRAEEAYCQHVLARREMSARSA